MIVVEDKLEAIFSFIPEIKQINGTNKYKHTFGYGDLKELNAFIKFMADKKDPYPLIWLLYPYQEKHYGRKVELKGFNIVLAVNTNVSMLNRDRLATTYSKVLNPLFIGVRDTLIRASNTNFNGEIILTKFPNYSEDGSSTHASISIWDAYKLTLDLTITDNCLRDINF